MEPLIVTAHLQNGFASADPWSPSLDGILAYWHVREQMGGDEFAVASCDSSQMQAVTGLPLEVIEHDGLWWYAASVPQYDAQARFLRYYHRRFDVQLSETYLQPQKARVNIKGGPTKNFRLSAQVHVCRTVRWDVVGEAAEIERLLRRCTHIGARTAAGIGRVMRWEVSPDGDADLARHHRPLPAEYAAARGIEGALMDWGLRPPGRIRGNQCLCVMPA